MGNLSIKTKLMILSGALLFLVAFVGGTSYYGEMLLMKSLNDITHVQLPAVRNMTLTDMMHDGLASVVYQSLYIAEKPDATAEQKKEVADQLKELTDNMHKSISDIDALDIKPETKTKIADAKPKIESYVKSVEEITALALGGRKDLAEAKVPEFQTAFTELEEKLEALGEQIENDAKDSDVEAPATSHTLKIVTGSISLIGILFGLFLSTFLIRDLMRVLNSTVENLKRTSDKISTAAAQSASSSTELSEASTEQAASLQETMASVEEISAMVSQNAESASRAKTVVDANQTASEDGSRSVSDMLVAIDEIKKTNDQILGQMETSNKEFGEIVKIISEIGEKTKVINDIVFQTKLLSFNASVEAARAGEHGKGFAVVAEEVGNLAQMSGNAAKEISDMLSASIKQVNEIVDQTTRRVDQLVEVGKDKISMGQSTAQKCRDALAKMAENARTVTTMIAEISNASKEQDQGVQEINKAISQLDQVTQQNSAVAQQSSAQAEQLNSEANSLSSAVSLLVKFIVGHNNSSASSPIDTSNVIPMPTARAAKGAVPAKLSKAVGAQTPSANDPGFEEF